MAKFEEHRVSSVTRLILVGDSGAGKTSALASIANGGYNLRVIDADGQLDPLAGWLTKEGLKRTSYITIKDDIKPPAKAWKRFRQIINKGWVDGKEDLGKVQDWTDKDVLAIDSATFLGMLAKNEALSINGRPLDSQLTMTEWGEAVRMMKAQLDYLINPLYFSCNLVVTAIPIGVENDIGITKHYPSCVTRNFSKEVPTYFNNVIQIKSKRDGSKVLRTVSDTFIELKTSIPNIFEKEIEPDLAAFMHAIQNAAKGKK